MMQGEGDMRGGAPASRLAAVVFAIAWLAAVPGCFHAVCDCSADVGGVVVLTDTPITEVMLSGAACAGGTFRCVPAAFDSTIHGDCMELQVQPRTEGECVVDFVTAEGGMTVRRQIVRSAPGCCGGGLVATNDDGTIDLRHPPDAGSADARIDQGQPTDGGSD